jgi:hypothetical protein
MIERLMDHIRCALVLVATEGVVGLPRTVGAPVRGCAT